MAEYTTADPNYVAEYQHKQLSTDPHDPFAPIAIRSRIREPRNELLSMGPLEKVYLLWLVGASCDGCSVAVTGATHRRQLQGGDPLHGFGATIPLPAGEAKRPPLQREATAGEHGQAVVTKAGPGCTGLNSAGIRFRFRWPGSWSNQ